MITYSRQELQRQLVSDQALWSRLPSSIAAILWPIELLLLSWTPGWWWGVGTVLFLSVASVILPPKLRRAMYLVDLLERLARLPLSLLWLAVVWHLSAREPIFPLLGQPALGAVVVTAVLWGVTRLLVLVTRAAARWGIARFHRNA